MVQKVEVLLVDDLDGGKADEIVTFSLDGVQYEIDLSSEHAAQLREELARYVGAARKVPGRRGRRPGRKAAAGQPSSREVREWAKSQGIEVSERGRIPQDVYVKFQEARG
ncbi:hypothetical protein TH66_01675 [Carbonactinospora thermoautotrophica]|uniref:Lsr2 family protein n=1 Tax=Carbonactinospora thermoautotrophica TaxID=1469144 RepID=A0A132N6L0_9ACTN|nr:Lsr2 family protein [Carbonactinospora thermoautotrophica]KWX01258.1 Uncharacterized protein LI90_2286 [Carbonactinospora thermoautotrophica]KWX05759.1 hypothetical protein TH66_01675 [Carbonactinospora thermoautotrophica]